VKYLCSLPTLFIRKKNGWIKPNITFGKYITDGYKGHKATWEDFHMHLKSVWMTIRLRETIEFRAIDALPPSLTPSAAAFMKGLYYHPDFCSVVQGLTKYWSFDDYNNLLEDISRNGLQASIRYTKVLDIAKELLRMSDDRLKRDRIVNFKGQNESVHLEPLKKLILVQEKCPARWLMEKWETTWGQNFFPVFEWEKY
jgi:glutamate--cysteine ligase